MFKFKPEFKSESRSSSRNRSESEGVSEVLGEMLLLVIVVILSAAFANYAMGMLTPVKNTPQCSIVGYTNGSNYTLTIEYGEPLPLSDLTIHVTYNYTTNPETIVFSYNYTSGNVAVFTANANTANTKTEKAYRFLTGYNRTWSFGELLNIPRSGNCTVIEVCCGNAVVATLHFPEG